MESFTLSPRVPFPCAGSIWSRSMARACSVGGAGVNAARAAVHGTLPVGARAGRRGSGRVQGGGAGALAGR
jgi:hypothetical protein